MALIHGKLSSDQENMEDILTSNVFGVLKYLPPWDALVPFISKAKSTEGEQPLANLPKDVTAECEFWPWLQEPGCEGCEPDVLIRIGGPHSKKTLVLVEAKYRSGKSSDEGEDERPNDQLAREWDNLKRLAAREGAEPVLIYLTTDFAYPAADIESSQHESMTKRGERGRICWLSWRHLASVISRGRHKMLEDLVAFLRRLNLTFFEGFSRIDLLRAIQWKFTGVPVRFEWKSPWMEETVRWGFKG